MTNKVSIIERTKSGEQPFEGSYWEDSFGNVYILISYRTSNGTHWRAIDLRGGDSWNSSWKDASEAVRDLTLLEDGSKFEVEVNYE